MPAFPVRPNAERPPPPPFPAAGEPPGADGRESAVGVVDREALGAGWGGARPPAGSVVVCMRTAVDDLDETASYLKSLSVAVTATSAGIVVGASEACGALLEFVPHPLA